MMNMVFQSLPTCWLWRMETGKRRICWWKTAGIGGGLWDMGKYHETSCRLDLVTAEKDADTVIDTLEEMMANVGNNGENFADLPL